MSIKMYFTLFAQFIYTPFMKETIQTAVFRSDVLKAKRKQCGYKQNEIAEIIGVSPSAYNQWELGLSKPESSNLALLCRLLSCKAEDFFYFPAKFLSKQ